MPSSPFEIGMLACFGASWPVSIAKALRTHVVRGKSSVFMVLVFIGYLCGITHKVLYAPGDPVVWLYAFNASMVAIDWSLYQRYRACD